MATLSTRRRRLWDAYAFPGFRPQPTVRGCFGDPKARVITLVRRSKKQPAGVAVGCKRVGTIGQSPGIAGLNSKRVSDLDQCIYSVVGNLDDENDSENRMK
jgi:hypothetical protein